MGDALKIALPHVGELSFGHVSELDEFLASQMKQFSWLVEYNVDIHNSIYRLVQSVRPYIGRDDIQHWVDINLTNKDFPFEGTPLSHFIDVTKDADKALAALMLGIISGAVTVDLRQVQHRRAVGSLFAFDQQLTPRSIEASRAAMTRAITAFQRQEQAARSRGTAYNNRLEAAEARYERLLVVGRRYVAHKLAMKRRADDERLGIALDEMAATKALYMEHMALKAPVEYWSKKAGSHTEKSKVLRSVLLKFALLGGGGLTVALAVFSVVAMIALSYGVPTSVLVLLATIGVLLTTITFWAGRILTRLYLSEVHLSIDAGERATMVETYLALTSVSQASKEDRAIILSSLFRPTADGIVKDDAAPDMSPAGILSKFGAPG